MTNTPMTTPGTDDLLEDMAQTLAKYPGYRVLRKLPEPYTILADEIPENGRIIAIVDTETTGLDPENDTVIELAIQLLIVDHNGEVVGQTEPESWLQDPGKALDPKIAMITGLNDADLVGGEINVEYATKLLQRADLIVAHNAPFDCAFVERLLPEIRGKSWACSCSEIPWLDLGLEGRGQSHLLLQHNWFGTAHRAAADVWSLFWLLTHHRTSDGWTYLKGLIRVADRPTVQVEATNASYSKKDLLRAHGYKWNSNRKVWWTSIEYQALKSEKEWLSNIGVTDPRCTNQTAAERHRPG